MPRDERETSRSEAGDSSSSQAGRAWQGETAPLDSLDVGSSSHAQAPQSDTFHAMIGHQIGGYRILRELGRGGMGVVYEAEQRQPRRLVALKVIRGDHFVDDTHIRLFEREIQTLARLKHPGIASIYESGCTPEGRQFFAMELVRGVTLNEFANAESASAAAAGFGVLDDRARLALFCKICNAINYAHQRGVIHRDLKPGNIIVTRETDSTHGTAGRSGISGSLPGVEIKILDFGVARIIDADVAATTILTEPGRVVGTLRYMSPEQARGDADAIDLRTDVYSLGVILFELMTGQPPYELSRGAPHESLRIVAEEQPRAPHLIRRGLKGDVETIILKALEKEPERRYQSAAAMAEDIERFLTEQPILARPPSAAYQLSKLVRRHKVTFSLILMLFVSVSAVALVALYQRDKAIEATTRAFDSLEEANKAKDKATREAAKARRVQTFLETILVSADPAEAQGRDVTLIRSLLDNAARRAENDLSEQPDVQASVHSYIGTTYKQLGLLEDAEKHFRVALELMEKLHEGDNEETAMALRNLGTSLTDRGEWKAAEELHRRALGMRERLFGRDSLEASYCLHNLAIVAEKRGRAEEGESLYRECIAHRTKHLGPDDPGTAITLNNLGLLLQRQERYKEAETSFKESIRIRRMQSPNSPDLALTLNNLAMLMQAVNRLDEAEPLHAEALEIRRRVLEPEHGDLSVTLSNYGELLFAMGRLRDAEPFFKEALPIMRKQLGEGHIGVYNTVKRLKDICAEFEETREERQIAFSFVKELRAILKMRRQDWEGAADYFNDAAEIRETVQSASHQDAMRARFLQAQCLIKVNQHGLALPVLEALLPRHRAELGADSWQTARCESLLAACFIEADRVQEAEPLLLSGLRVLAREMGDADERTQFALDRLVAVYTMTGRDSLAEVYARRLISMQ